MERRSFLKGLLGVTAAAVAAPVMKWIPQAPPAAPVLATVGQYADYINISDLSLATSLDPITEQAAKELAYRAALTLDLTMLNQLSLSPTFNRQLAEAGYRMDRRAMARFERAIRRERYQRRQWRQRRRMAA